MEAASRRNGSPLRVFGRINLRFHTPLTTGRPENHAARRPRLAEIHS